MTLRFEHLLLQCQPASCRSQQQTTFRGAFKYHLILAVTPHLRFLKQFTSLQVEGVGLDAKALDSELSAVRRRNQVSQTFCEFFIFVPEKKS
jgi:hypothetical protein